MRDKTRTVYHSFVNATVKVEKNPTYTGNHFLARVNRVSSCTYPLGTTEQEMIDQYHNSVVLEKTSTETRCWLATFTAWLKFPFTRTRLLTTT